MIFKKGTSFEVSDTGLEQFKNGVINRQLNDITRTQKRNALRFNSSWQ